MHWSILTPQWMEPLYQEDTCLRQKWYVSMQILHCRRLSIVKELDLAESKMFIVQQRCPSNSNTRHLVKTRMCLKQTQIWMFFWTMIVLLFTISNIYKTPSLPESKWCFQLPLNISTNLPPNLTLNWCGRKGDFLRKTHFIYSRHGTKISHLWKRKISFPATFKGDMLVPWRVFGGYLECIWISHVSYGFLFVQSRHMYQKRRVFSTSQTYLIQHVARQVVGRCTHFWLAQLVWADFFLVAAGLKEAVGMTMDVLGRVVHVSCWHMYMLHSIT